MLGLQPADVFALAQEKSNFYAQNDIVFYDPDASNCYVDSEGSSISASESYGGLSAVQVGFVDTYHDIAASLSIKYGIPWETVMAQGILESASGNSNLAKNRNNFFGIGAYDSNPDHAYSYDSPKAGWEGYYKNIAKTATYRNHGVFSGETVTDPYAYAKAIKAAGYATASHYVASVSDLISKIEKLSEERGWPSSSEMANQYPEWKENAAKYSQGGTNNSEEDYASMDTCATGGALINGGMNLEQAQAFMQAYRKEASKKSRGDQKFQGALVKDSGCKDGALNNCSAFTEWFLNRYTTLGPDKVMTRQGSQAVKRYLKEFPELVNGGKTPKVYAVVSMGPNSGKADGWSNHTGIVLGIDKEKDTIIIGEAACSNGYTDRFPGAHEYSLSKYTNGPSKYAPTYAYTDNVLKEVPNE